MISAKLQLRPQHNNSELIAVLAVIISSYMCAQRSLPSRFARDHPGYTFTRYIMTVVKILSHQLIPVRTTPRNSHFINPRGECGWLLGVIHFTQ